MTKLYRPLRARAVARPIPRDDEQDGRIAVFGLLLVLTLLVASVHVLF